MQKQARCIVGLTLGLPLLTLAQIDLTTLDRDMVGPQAQVLVLGTVHLRNMPENFEPSSLNSLLDRLAGFQPDIITVEALPGEECDLAARHPAKYGANYCSGTNTAQAATGLNRHHRSREDAQDLASTADAIRTPTSGCTIPGGA